MDGGASPRRLAKCKSMFCCSRRLLSFWRMALSQRARTAGTEKVRVSKPKRIYLPRIICDHVMVQEDFERLHEIWLANQTKAKAHELKQHHADEGLRGPDTKQILTAPSTSEPHICRPRTTTT